MCVCCVGLYLYVGVCLGKCVRLCVFVGWCMCVLRGIMCMEGEYVHV